VEGEWKMDEPQPKSPVVYNTLCLPAMHVLGSSMFLSQVPGLLTDVYTSLAHRSTTLTLGLGWKSSHVTRSDGLVLHTHSQSLICEREGENANGQKLLSFSVMYYYTKRRQQQIS
jgi:hypothetical protein